MRDGPPDQVLAGAPSWVPSVSSWLDGALLADNVPVVSGLLSVDSGQQVAERLTLSVPERLDGTSWVPGDDPYHPLARYGQQLSVSVSVTSPVSGVQWQTPLGGYQVQSWSWDRRSGVVSVECVGLLQRLADARFTTPAVPRAGDTLVSLLVRLVGDGMPVVVDPALTDRAVPTSWQWGEDRLGAVWEIADAWPARLSVDPYGQLLISPPLPATAVGVTPVVTLTDGLGGTVIAAPTSQARDGVYNVVVARSSATDDPARPPVQGIAQVTSGPLSAAGPYGQVVRFWSSPLATTRAQLEASAAALLATSLRPATTRTVTCAPDPRLEVGDPVQLVIGRTVKHASLAIVGSARTDRVVVADERAAVTSAGFVSGYDLPLVAGEAMSLRVAVP